MATVKIIAELPDAQLEEFLQLLRAWDDKKTDRHMQIGVEAPSFTSVQMLAMFKRLSPLFDDMWYVPRPNMQKPNEN